MSDLKDSEAEARTIAAVTKVKAISSHIEGEKQAELKAQEDAKRLEESIQAKLQKVS